MQDFRTVQDTVKRVVARLRKEDDCWSWRADVLKGEIRVWWGYLQYADNKDSHFTITESTNPEESLTDGFIVARDEKGYYMCGAILGNDVGGDGDLSKCVELVLYGIDRIAHSRY